MSRSYILEYELRGTNLKNGHMAVSTIISYQSTSLYNETSHMRINTRRLRMAGIMTPAVRLYHFRFATEKISSARFLLQNAQGGL
jgi:hypothetical protein